MIIRYILAITLTILVAMSTLHAQKIDPVDEELGFSTGISVGETVPNFSLADQNGEVRALQDMVGPNGALLNFFRSASW